jgi:hypothetical protein
MEIILKKLLLLIMLISQSIFAQELAKPSTFHRLLVFNDNNELLVVKVKNSDRWVTPGWYQDHNLTIQAGLDELAASYGLKITTPTLRGVFTLKTTQNNELSTRLVYTTKMKSGELKAPEMIEEIRWLSPKDAMKLITFAHINVQIDQLMKFPGTLWGGSQQMYQQDGVYKAKFIEPFYPLTAPAI